MPQKQPSVVMWQGLGILSPKGIVLEAYGESSKFVLDKHKAAPKGSRLVLVTARLEHVSARKIASDGDFKLGIVPSRKLSRRTSKRD